MQAKTVCIFLLSAFAQWTANAQEREEILWYDTPARTWTEALPVGNGRIGAMVYGDHYRETIQLNEESLWSGYKNEPDADAAAWLPEIQRLLLDDKIPEAMALAEEHMLSDPLRIRPYQTFGELNMDFYGQRRFAPRPTDYRRILNLGTAITSVEYRLGDITYTREVLASAPDNILVIRMESSQPGGITCRLSYKRDQDAATMAVSDQLIAIRGQVLDLPDRQMGEQGPHLSFGGYIAAKNRDGQIKAVNNSLFIENVTELTIYVCLATDYNYELLDYDRSIDPLQKAMELLDNSYFRSFEEIRQRHLEEYSPLFNRVSFHLGEPNSLEMPPTDKRLNHLKETGEEDLSLLSLYFQYGRYLLLSSSRSPGILPANLQGIWNQEMYPLWNCDFHTNINIQMNYWPAEVCNLSETVIPFSNLIESLKEPGRVTARKTFNSTGWTMNHVSDIFGRTAITDGIHGIFPMAAPWLVLHQWEHYLFTENKEYLRETAYPTMKEAAEFVKGFLIEDKKGQLVTAPSVSPENRFILPDGKNYSITYGSTMDIQIIRELFNACIRASELLGTDKTFRKELQGMLKKLPPVKIGQRYNTIQEWIEDYEELEPGHRHISHLFGLYPGTTITPKDKAIFDAARRTIERRQEYNQTDSKLGTAPGWSRAWMINFYARLLDGNKAGETLQGLLEKCTLSNLFNTHPPFQIDGNFGGTAGIAEMLLQSHTNEIRLLPALPDSWKEGEIKGLKARGGLEIDMKWENGRLTEASILSATSKKCKIRYNNQIRTISLAQGVPYILN